jgi:hypothetical protein
MGGGLVQRHDRQHDRSRSRQAHLGKVHGRKLRADGWSGTEGTEGAATLHDTEIRDSLCLLWAQVTDTTASRVYQMIQTSIPNRMGLMFAPRKCALFIAHSMVAALETSGNQVTVWGDKGTA